MRLPIPGPADLFQAASALRDGVEDALGLVPRLVTVVGRVESLLDRAEVVVERIEGTVERADESLRAVAAIDVAARELVVSVERTTERAEAIFDLYEAPLRSLAPSVRSFIDKLDPAEVTAMIDLVDRLPRLLKHLDEDLFPVLTTLDRVAPDLHQLLEIAQDMQVALGGLPGMSWLRKRADKEEEEAAQEARAIQTVTGKPLGKPKARSKPKG
ncbi:MAG: hypothetical protein M3400_05385 [Actinomycetota bacterium]|nr:hypothetical protein [Actinomycetota bacterium]